MEHDIRTKLIRKIGEYAKAISSIEFAQGEITHINTDPKNDDELLETIEYIIDKSKELNHIIEQSPSSIYVADVNGKTLRINRAFEELTEVKRSEILNKSVEELEKANMFQPSVCMLALREGRRVIIRQIVNENKEFITAGVPIINENGEIFRVITNALLHKEVNEISDYINNNKNHNYDETAELVYKSDKMDRIIKLVDKVKNTDTTVLITGETGVGKGVLARYIHKTSNRAEKPMIEINCGAIPHTLLESELFGYDSGAFTGADKQGKAGLIESGNGGTVLLDEISELPLLLQVKLLHFLQSKKITRIGGTKEIPVNVRIIAATNQQLEELVKRGEFRSDLYYRLDVVPVYIPPLRERKEDIKPAVDYFLDKYRKRYGKRTTCFEYDEDSYYNNPWPGNMRELENHIERMVVTGEDVNIEAERLELIDEGYVEKKEVEQDKFNEGIYEMTMEDIEKEMVCHLYKKYRSSYKVALSLGISQASAYRKIKKYMK